MPRYAVTYLRYIWETYYVEADDEEQAEELADDMVEVECKEPDKIDTEFIDTEVELA